MLQLDPRMHESNSGFPFMLKKTRLPILQLHPLIHFLRHLLKLPREQKSTVSARHVYLHLRTRRLHGSLVITIPRSDRVSTENGWKSVLLENVNCVNLNRFRLKRLIPIERDLRPDPNAAPLMCRTKLNKVRLRSDFGATADSYGVLLMCRT